VAVQVEAEVAHVGPALRVDHHVVAVVAGDTREIGHFGQPRRVEPQQAAILHGDHQQPPVGEPA
jgi:hypothetical protein